MIGMPPWQVGAGRSLGSSYRLAGIQEDSAWFEKNRNFIAQQYGGQFVLIKDQQVRGAYASYQDAFNAGVAMFGTEPFVVEQAVTDRPIHKV